MDRQNNPFLGNSDSSSNPKNDTDQDSQAAADLVRAKLASIYGGTDQTTNSNDASQSQVHDQSSVPSQPQQPSESHDKPLIQSSSQANPAPAEDFGTFKIPRGNKATSATGTLYAREQSLQQTINHTPHVTQPDHELPAPNTSYELPASNPHYELPAHDNTYQTRQQKIIEPLPQPSQELTLQQVTPQQQSTTVQPPSSQPPQTIAERLQNSQPQSRKEAVREFKKQAQTTYKNRNEKLKFWKRTQNKQPKENRPLFRTALLTALVLVLYNNQLISGQINYYISPGDAIVSPQIIDPTTDNAVGPEPFVIIPKINVQVPTVYGVETRNDDVIQDHLEKGVVHYARTALPGQVGNTVILGHSSNSFWNGGQHKNAFSLLDRLEIGDTYMIHYEGKRYVYEVFNKEVIEPTEFRVVSQETDGLPISTLITCTPPGTSWKRLVIQAEQISHDPLEAEKVEIVQNPEDQEILAGNTRSLWDNVRDWLFD